MKGGNAINKRWNIHNQEVKDVQYFSDLLNRRVLDLWKHTKWGMDGEEPIKYLRSERGDDIYASWCRADADIYGDRGQESCYYLISGDGVAVVREFNEYLLLENDQHLNGAALTIIQDVMGEYDFEPVCSAFLKEGLGVESVEIPEEDYNQEMPTRNNRMDFSKYSREQLIKALDQEYRDLSGEAPDVSHDSVEEYLDWLQGLTLEELQEEIVDSIEGDNSYLDEKDQITLDDFMAKWL